MPDGGAFPAGHTDTGTSPVFCAVPSDHVPDLHVHGKTIDASSVFRSHRK